MVNGDKDYQNWKVSQAEFRGFMKAKVEDICNKLDVVSKHNGEQDTRINSMEKSLIAVKIKGGIFGTIGGLIGGFVSGFIK